MYVCITVVTHRDVPGWVIRIEVSNYCANADTQNSRRVRNNALIRHHQYTTYANGSFVGIGNAIHLVTHA